MWDYFPKSRKRAWLCNISEKELRQLWKAHVFDQQQLDKACEEYEEHEMEEELRRERQQLREQLQNDETRTMPDLVSDERPVVVSESDEMPDLVDDDETDSREYEIVD